MIDWLIDLGISKQIHRLIDGLIDWLIDEIYIDTRHCSSDPTRRISLRLVGPSGIISIFGRHLMPVDGVAPTFHKLHGHSVRAFSDFFSLHIVFLHHFFHIIIIISLQGVIFSMDYHADRQLLCSTSDDRSCRVYRCSFHASASSSPLNRWKSVIFTFLHALYGHEARVWRGKILSDCVVTVGEDSRCAVWSDRGHLVEQWTSSGVNNIWSLAVWENTESLIVFTGGADGGMSAREIPRFKCPSTTPSLKSAVSPQSTPVNFLFFFLKNKKYVDVRAKTEK